MHHSVVSASVEHFQGAAALGACLDEVPSGESLVLVLWTRLTSTDFDMPYRGRASSSAARTSCFSAFCWLPCLSLSSRSTLPEAGITANPKANSDRGDTFIHPTFTGPPSGGDLRGQTVESHDSNLDL